MDIKKLYKIEDMSNFGHDDTGLPVVVWFEHKRTTKHKKPRLKVEIDHDLISVSVEDNPVILVKDKDIPAKIWNKVVEFIKLNKQQLIEYWNSTEFTTGQLIRSIKKV